MTAPGIARGALSGYYPEPGPGHRLLVGFDLSDDFHWTPSSTTRPGVLNWAQTTVTSAPTWSTQSDGPTELGIRRAVTALSANTGGVLRSNETILETIPPIGASFAAKVSMGSGSRTASRMWTGFSSSTTVAPATANTVDFIGFYQEDGGNWYGVCKNGGAGADTRIDLGIDSSDWRILGFDVIDIDGAGTAGVQFWYANATDRRALYITRVGDPQTTNHPTGASLYAIAFGVLTTDASSKTGQIDLWSLVGRLARL